MEIFGPAGAVPPDTLALIECLLRTIPVQSVRPSDRALVIIDALGTITVPDLARLFDVGVWRGYDLLGELVAGGLARRTARSPDRTDRRRGAASIVLTEAGHQAAQQARGRLGSADLGLDAQERHGGHRSALHVAIVVGRIDTVPTRALVAVLLLGRSATYAELREHTACGERSTRTAVSALRRRGLLERAVLPYPRAGAVFQFRLTYSGRETALRIVGEIDADLRRVGFAVALSAAPAAWMTAPATGMHESCSNSVLTTSVS